MIRMLLIVLALAGMLQIPIPQALAQDEAEHLDLAAIPVPPSELAETGYLLEGGGYLDGSGQVSLILQDLLGTDSVALTDLQNAFMYRSVLLADRFYPGSEQLADEITLVLQFADDDGSGAALTELEEMLQESGTSIEVDTSEGSAVTYNTIVDSAESLTSLVADDSLVVVHISTDLTGEPDLADHLENVAAIDSRLDDADDEGLAGSALLVVAEKDVTFADDPVAHQHYAIADGAWIQTIDFPEPDAVPGGLEQAFESQQVLSLNNASDIFIQTWVAEFDSESEAREFAENPDLGVIPSPLFDVPELGAISGVNSDDQRYSGYRMLVQDDDRIAIVALYGTGNLLINEDQVTAFAQLQETCLQTLCEPVDIDEFFQASPNETTPDSEAGVYTDPQFGWSVNYEAAGFELTSVEAGQILELQNGNSLATVEAVVDRHGDPTSCILEQVHLLETLEEHSEITLGSDEGETPVGREEGHAWAIYTVEPLEDERADQEYTIRFDCYTLVEGNASLVVSFTAPRYEWGTEAAKGKALLEELSF